MDDDALPLGPGEYAASNGDGELPQDNATISNLTPSFTPNLDNLLPPLQTPMSSSSGYGSLSGYIGSAISEDAAGNVTNSGSGSYGSLFGGTSSGSLFGNSSSSLFSGLATAGNSLLSAFVTTPQNAQTLESEELAKAQINSAVSGQYFGYILIGLGIFLVFTLIEKE